MGVRCCLDGLRRWELSPPPHRLDKSRMVHIRHGDNAPSSDHGFLLPSHHGISAMADHGWEGRRGTGNGVENSPD